MVCTVDSLLETSHTGHPCFAWHCVMCIKLMHIRTVSLTRFVIYHGTIQKKHAVPSYQRAFQLLDGVWSKDCIISLKNYYFKLLLNILMTLLLCVLFVFQWGHLDMFGVLNECCLMWKSSKRWKNSQTQPCRITLLWSTGRCWVLVWTLCVLMRFRCSSHWA